ncbi:MULTISPECIES: aromatase/cyclase [unclassified Frankia]|uniref:aromatase/cyclase n=1 Tax=unclassified Frankia TaxID=2632575 RepID=UPI002E8086C7|nr:aromatase/cyclase [Frankia sp. CcI6]
MKGAPTVPTKHRTSHREVVAAPADLVFELLTEAERWPAIFGPNIFLRYLERTESEEHFQLWALVGGEVKTWTSRREVDRHLRTIGFRQERSQPPVAAMSGRWQVLPLPGGRTEVILDHEFTAVDDDAAAVQWISAALERNSVEELAALRRVAELGHPVAEVVFTFEDTVELTGSAEEAYDFIDRADRWPDQLPHVRRVVLTEEMPGIQQLEMDTVSGDDGSTHTARSVRVCLANDRIAYKQTRPPSTLLGHSGVWIFHRVPDGPDSVTARHTVVLDPDALRTVLGPSSSLAEGRRYLRDALGANSRRTLAGAAAPVSSTEEREVR